VKLYLVVRRDLTPGARAAQLCHAMRQFADEHPRVERAWFEASNTLVLLEVDDEPALAALASDASSRGVDVARFHEPDLGHALTAIALGPTARSLVRRLPLALRPQ
jgi:peptidyl-tRNA hydrolase